MKKIAYLLFIIVTSWCRITQAQITVDSVNLVHLGTYTDMYRYYTFNINDYKGMMWKYNDNKWLKTYVYTNNIRISSATNKINFYNTQSGSLSFNTIQVRSVITHDDQTRTTSKRNLVNGLEKIVSIQPVSYQDNSDIDTQGNKKKKTAFTTESIKKHLPNLLIEDWTGETLLDINGLIPLLVNAVQSLKKQADEQNIEIARLKKQLSTNYQKQLAHELTDISTTSEKGNHLGPIKFISSKNKVLVMFYLRNNVNFAQVRIADENGRILAEKELSERGKGLYSFNGIKWTTGIYFCSLVVDNTIIETRKFSKE